jgi:hypothetical protein
LNVPKDPLWQVEMSDRSAMIHVYACKSARNAPDGDVVAGTSLCATPAGLRCASTIAGPSASG